MILAVEATYVAAKLGAVYSRLLSRSGALASDVWGGKGQGVIHLIAAGTYTFGTSS